MLISESQHRQIDRPQTPVAGDGRTSGNKAPRHERDVSEPQDPPSNDSVSGVSIY